MHTTSPDRWRLANTTAIDARLLADLAAVVGAAAIYFSVDRQAVVARHEDLQRFLWPMADEQSSGSLPSPYAAASC